MSRRTIAPAIAIVIGLVLAGCGGGDDDEGSGPSTTTTVVVTTTTQDPEAAPEDPFCVTYGTFSELVGSLPENTLEQLKARTEQTSAAANALVTVAPDDLRDEADLISTGANDLEAAVAGATTLEQAQAAAAPIVGDDAYLLANEAMGTWVAANCES